VLRWGEFLGTIWSAAFYWHRHFSTYFGRYLAPSAAVGKLEPAACCLERSTMLRYISWLILKIVSASCFVQRYGAQYVIEMLIMWFWHFWNFYAHAHIIYIYTQNMCNRPLYTYVNMHTRCVHCLAAALLHGKEIFLVFRVSRPTQPSIEWVLEGKRAGAWGWVMSLHRVQSDSFTLSEHQMHKGRPTFLFCKGPPPFLWAESRTARDKTATFGSANRRNCCVFL